MSGSLPNFYPPGPPGPEIDGMGSMVDVFFRCSMDAKYVASWGKGYQSKADAIQNVKAQYEADAARSDATRPAPSRISVNERDDIGMIEVLYERGRGKYTDGMPMWEATYWPITGELKGVDGVASAITCKTRHDPPEHRYGGVGWRCSTGVRITPHGGAQIDIYVSQLQHMPSIFEQVKQLLVNAQQISRQ